MDRKRSKTQRTNKAASQYVESLIESTHAQTAITEVTTIKTHLHDDEENAQAEMKAVEDYLDWLRRRQDI